MNCDAVVVRGQSAWLPNRSATDLDALHVHDIPLIGTFVLGRETMLFACLTGATSVSSIWGYTALDASALTELESSDFETTEALEEWAHQHFIGNRAALAWARDGVVFRWSSDDIDAGGVLEAAVRFMDLQLAQIHQSDETPKTKQRRAAQARADATLKVLEPA